MTTGAEKQAFIFGADATSQYAALGNELRFYADQRFKIAGAFLISNGLLANVAKDQESVGLAMVGIVLSYLCLSWEKKTTLWWGFLIEALKKLEQRGVNESKFVEAYLLYSLLPKSHIFVRPSQAAAGIYYLFGIAWLAFAVYSWPQWW